MTHEMYDGSDLVFVVGCPRSGTTWVQRLLACCTGVRTGQESDVFDQYVGPQLRHWRRDLSGASSARGVGLGCYLGEDEFMGALRGYMLTLLAPMRGQLAPGEVFVEKTPSHALYLPEIMELLPGCKVVGVVRDCRDTCASLLAAGRSWGAYWAPKTAQAAARMWVAHQKAMRAQAPALGPARYREVRYENLCKDTAGVLADLANGFLGLGVDEDILRDAPARCAPGSERMPDIPVGGEWAAKARREAVEEPQGFVRKARRGSWREDLSLRSRIAVWRIARREMAASGYPWRFPW